MKQEQKNIIFWDDIIREYALCLGSQWESTLANDLLKYFSTLSKSSKIIIITCQNIEFVSDWLKNKNLISFIDDIIHPQLQQDS